MSDEDRTEPHARAGVGQPASVVAGETELPLEHTARVRAARGEAAPSKLTVHDERPREAEPAPRSSTELAERARRQRRRERDRRAERRAIFVVVALFVGLGGAALAAVNLLWEEPPARPPTDPAGAAGAGEVAEAPAPEPTRPTGVISTPLEETPYLPVIRKLRQEGLTIGAEGLPEVLALEDGPEIPKHAALESCRFAYAVWELSPNKRFRFLTTCGALEGQILVGAYVVQGTKVRMSPIGAQGIELVTELDLEKPTEATTTVRRAGAPTAMLAVKQRLTAIRPGLDGGAFYDSFAPRNTIAPRRGRGAPGGAAAPPPPPPPAPRDPVLDLLEGNP